MDTRQILELNPLSKLVQSKPSLLTLLDLAVTAGPRRGDCPLVRLPHNIGTGVAGPTQAQLSC